MPYKMRSLSLPFTGMLLIILTLSACNLSGAPEQEVLTAEPTIAVNLGTTLPTRTPPQVTNLPTLIIPTTNQQQVQQPTQVVILPQQPPQNVIPTTSLLPISVFILSPVPGSRVAGNPQVIGSASDPQFLQYQLEYGPEPNGSNLWFPITNAVPSTVFNGLLGVWNTTVIPDGQYQLRLRIFLRDGSTRVTVINNITVQNRVNTPVPTATVNIPRPIAAFTQDVTSGIAPVTVRFTNQSTGTINNVMWSFGDGSTASEFNTTRTFNSPGVYNVTLTVSGPGGTSNVSRQINVTTATPPNAGFNFTVEPATGIVPATVRFIDQSTGNVTNWSWNFSDGTTSTERNPVRTFIVPGTYNIFLTVTGPGGASSVTRQLIVIAPLSATATFTPTASPTLEIPTLPPTATFTPEPPTVTPTFTNEPTLVAVVPTFTSEPPTATPTFTDEPTLVVVVPTATFTPEPPTAEPPTATPEPTTVPLPSAGFTAIQMQDNLLAVQFVDNSTPLDTIVNREWNFGDGSPISNETTPLHLYPAPGDYTVTLRVTDLVGQTAETSQLVSIVVPATAAPEPTPAPQTVLTGLPIIPDMNATIARGVIDAARANGGALNTVSRAGDSIVAQAEILSVFSGPYSLGSNGDLQRTIEWFNAPSNTDAQSSFSRMSSAVNNGWRIDDLLTPGRSGDPNCDPNENPLACELRLRRPVILLIAVGVNDVRGGTDVNTFRDRLRTVVQQTAAANTVPVLIALPPNGDARTLAFNDAIAAIAQEQNVPLINIWRQLQEMGTGVEGDGVRLSVSPTGASDLNSPAPETYGANGVNLTLLRSLQALLRLIDPSVS